MKGGSGYLNFRFKQVIYTTSVILGPGPPSTYLKSVTVTLAGGPGVSFKHVLKIALWRRPDTFCSARCVVGSSLFAEFRHRCNRNLKASTCGWKVHPKQSCLCNLYDHGRKGHKR